MAVWLPSPRFGERGRGRGGIRTMKRSQARTTEAIRFAKSQRQSANEFAATVWQWLRARRCCGVKFRREVPIPPYTADFCCLEHKLIIEVDGQEHFTEEGEEHDERRDAFLKGEGYRVLRIPGYEVIHDGGKVYQTIERFVKEAVEPGPSPPAPLPEAGRGEPA